MTTAQRDILRKRRVLEHAERIGMCEPDVPNRFLLWALFGILAALGSVSLIPLYVEYAVTQLWPVWGDYASGGLEAASTIVLWFVFFPPAFYRRWIAGAATQTETIVEH